jgi:glucose-1-phosphate adenylyltransferase
VSPFAVIEDGARVRDSIVQHGAVIGRGAVVDRAIIDKEVEIGQNALVGDGSMTIANAERPDILDTGISILGKRARIPAGFRIGRNVIIGPGVDEELRDYDELSSGATLMPTHMPLHLFV